MEVSAISSKLDKLCTERGISQSALAREVKVSREAVSNWFGGENMPRPRHLLLIAAALGVSVAELKGETPAVAEPVVSYRVKRNQRIKPGRDAEYRRDMLWLQHLEKRLVHHVVDPLPRFQGSPDEETAARMAAHFRGLLGLRPEDDSVPGKRLLDLLAARGIIILPVMWGGKRNSLNGMHVRFPGSLFDWLYIDLEESVTDLRFWLLHEIAHMMRPDNTVAKEEEDALADLFAAEVLFPLSHARRLLPFLQDLCMPSQVQAITRTSVGRSISPVTVYRQLQRAALEAGTSFADLGAGIYSADARLRRKSPSLVDRLFAGQRPGAVDYVRSCREYFHTPVFSLVAAEIRQKDRGYGFTQRIFQYSVEDALALHEGLREYGTAEDSR